MKRFSCTLIFRRTFANIINHHHCKAHRLMNLTMKPLAKPLFLGAPTRWHASMCAVSVILVPTDSLVNSIIYIFISGTTLISTSFILEYYSRSSTRISSWLNFFISSDFYFLSESINSAFSINLNCLWQLLNFFHQIFSSAMAHFHWFPQLIFQIRF